ncbi:response regulator [Brenneria goodwinii]|uniref:response regulator n=1 Tax=Brenneria goodwinii TaxID=1109412 RepID=UPI0036EC2B61
MTILDNTAGTAPIDILVVEDSRTQALRLALTLRQHGYRPTMACNGREALELLRGHKPALVISDVVMPEIDGYELTCSIKSDPMLNDLPVILVTNLSDPQEVIRALECGADGFILKPYQESHLIGRVRDVLLNHKFRHKHRPDEKVEIHFNGQSHQITAGRRQILDLLLSTYEVAIQRNQELVRSQQALESAMIAMQAEHRLMDTLVENQPVAILIKDAAKLCLILMNHAAEELFGCERTGMSGKAIADLLQSPEGVNAISLAEQQALSTRSIQTLPRLTVSLPHSGKRHLNIKVVPIPGDVGAPSHLMLMCEDITVRIEAEEELRILNAELDKARIAAEEGTKAKSAFLAMMSHEIRTPMHGVIGMVELLQQSGLSNDQREMVSLIHDSADTLLALVEDILDFSKIEAGKLELESAPFQVEKLIEQVCALLDKIAASKGVDLSMRVAPEIPREILGDELRLRQVLINLVGNAIKFSSGLNYPGCVSVSAGSLVVNGVPMLELSVRDNGIGIDVKNQARIFHLFEQADASTQNRFGGTGLGLAISQQLISLMGGRIRIYSRPGQGATFVIRLPCHPTGSVLPAERTGLLVGLSGFIISDDDGIATSHAAYLRHEGVAVEYAQDLAAARELMRQQPLTETVWIIDHSEAPSDEEMFYSQVAGDNAPKPAGVLIVERGRQRVCRRLPDGWYSLDGNVLARGRFIRAVAAVAGRLSWSEAQEPAGQTVEQHKQEQVRHVGQRVLVAEDNEVNQKVIRRQLALLGIDCDIAGNGLAALERWRSGDYSVVLTDVRMPEMDGYELAAAIRAEEGGNRRTVIVGISADAAEVAGQISIANGMDDYLSKPMRLETLRQRMEGYLAQTDSGGESEDSEEAPLVPVTPPPVDRSVLVALVGDDDPAVLTALMEEFRRSVKKGLDEIRSAALADDLTAVGAASHTLKSSASAFGAVLLSERCRRLESAGDGNDLSLMATLLPAFEAEAARVLRHLDGVDGEGPAQGG